MGFDLNENTLRCVERFVPDDRGPHDVPHMTLGLAQSAFLDSLQAEPFDVCAFHPAGVAVYRLGNNGTAQRLLKSWHV